MKESTQQTLRGIPWGLFIHSFIRSLMNILYNVVYKYSWSQFDRLGDNGAWEAVQKRIQIEGEFCSPAPSDNSNTINGIITIANTLLIHLDVCLKKN